MDPAKGIKTALEAAWRTKHPGWMVTLEIPAEYQPVVSKPVLLIADDGGGMVSGGAWLVGRDLMRITIRLTAFALGRTEARDVVSDAIDHLLLNRPAPVARIENVPAVMEARDRETGAFLASIVMPVLVRPTR